MRCCEVDVIGVRVVKNYILYLEFDNGNCGKVDISKIIPFKGIFEPLNDKDFFSSVHLNSDIGTICWKNGADISPDYLLKNIETNKE